MRCEERGPGRIQSAPSPAGRGIPGGTHRYMVTRDSGHARIQRGWRGRAIVERSLRDAVLDANHQPVQIPRPGLLLLIVSLLLLLMVLLLLLLRDQEQEHDQEQERGPMLIWRLRLRTPHCVDPPQAHLRFGERIASRASFTPIPRCASAARCWQCCRQNSRSAGVGSYGFW